MVRFFGRVGAVWNTSTDRQIVFKDGVYDTNDKEEIEFLTNQGYKHTVVDGRRKKASEHTSDK